MPVLIVTLLVAVPVVATPTCSLASTPTFRARYTCDLFGAVIPVDARMARQAAQIPDDFHLTGVQTGKAALEFDAAVCDPVTPAALPARRWSR